MAVTGATHTKCPTDEEEAQPLVVIIKKKNETKRDDVLSNIPKCVNGSRILLLVLFSLNVASFLMINTLASNFREPNNVKAKPIDVKSNGTIDLSSSTND